MNSFTKFLIKVGLSIDSLTGQQISKKIINTKIKEYGEMLDFKINNAAKIASATVLLNGENSPITIDVGEYRIVECNDKQAALTILKAKANREWISSLLNNFIVGKEFLVPKEVLTVLSNLG